MNRIIYEKYEIPCAGFDEQAFMQGMGGRLVEAGLSEVADELVALGASRLFMVRSMSVDRMREINSAEALVVAEQAAEFATRAQHVEIRESGEPMTHLPTIAEQSGRHWTFSRVPFHPACGEWAGSPRQFWVREGVAQCLGSVSSDLLGVDLGLHFEDAFRPQGVQEGLFTRRYHMARDEHPDWTHDQAILEAKSKTAYSARLASHKGGAAVDARAVDLRNGELLDLGHNYPDGGAHVALNSPLTTQKQWQNRMILAVIARRRGMEMFPFEDWHVCAGDNTAAACQQGDLPAAVYGPIKSFDFKTGEILEVYSGEALDRTFPITA